MFTLRLPAIFPVNETIEFLKFNLENKEEIVINASPAPIVSIALEVKGGRVLTSLSPFEKLFDPSFPHVIMIFLKLHTFKIQILNIFHH